MTNPINPLEIKKYIIATFGVDPTPLMDIYDDDDMRSSELKRRKQIAIKMIDDFKNKYNQSEGRARGMPLEDFVIKEIEDIYNLPRNKRKAELLLRAAVSLKIINADKYFATRAKWGYEEDEDKRNKLNQFLQKDEKKPDAFDILLG